MSKSHKARHGTRCKYWKDTGLNSRSQKRAWSKTKQRTRQRDRTRAKASLRAEAMDGSGRARVRRRSIDKR